MNSTAREATFFFFLMIGSASAQQGLVYYDAGTGLIHLEAFVDLIAVDIRSNAGNFLGERADFPHFDDIFDEYNAHRAFMLERGGGSFRTIHSFAQLPSGLTFDELVEDLSFDGAINDGIASFVLLASEPCTVCLDFDTPIADDVTIIGRASIQDAGGRPFGHLQLTNGRPEDAGAIILPQEISPANHRVIIAAGTDDGISIHHFDNLGLNSGLGESMTDSSNFSLTADVRIDGGSENPGSGFSINIVRPNDPILTHAENGLVAGFASSSDGQLNRIEEGATTGLAIGIDERSNGDADVVGISLRIDNQLVRQIPLETVNGSVDDPTSLQTGGSWAPLSISVSDAESNDYYGSHVTIDWKEHTIFDGPVAIVGDSNFDKRFDSSDLVHVFTAGLYETGDIATWESGDWNLDGIFDTSDLVTAFSADTFSNQAVQVPESSPSFAVLSVLFLSAIYICRQPRRFSATLSNVGW